MASYEGSFRRRIREWREKRPIRGQEKEDTKRLAFWLNRLVTEIDAGMRDEEEAIRFYDKLRTDIVAVYPPGTSEYETIVAITADEKRHYLELSRMKTVFLRKLGELGA